MEMTVKEILELIGMIIGLLVGTGGVFALVKYLYAKKKDSSKFEVRCRLAAEFLKRNIVKMTPEESKQLFIDILEGRLDTKTPEKEKEKIAKEVLKAYDEHKSIKK